MYGSCNLQRIWKEVLKSLLYTLSNSNLTLSKGLCERGFLNVPIRNNPDKVVHLLKATFKEFRRKPCKCTATALYVAPCDL